MVRIDMQKIKDGASSFKDGAVKVAQEEAEKRKEMRDAGLMTWDEKLLHRLRGLSPWAVLNRARLNRALKPMKAEEKAEKEGILKGEDLKTRLYIIGFLVVIGIIVLYNVMKFLEYIIPLYIIFWYLKTIIVFRRNAKLFDYKWIFDLVKSDPNWTKLSSSLLYYRLPYTAVARDNQLEDYLEERGKKGMMSGQKEYASINNSHVVNLEHYGYVRVFTIDNRWFRKPVSSLEEVELTDYYLIPQRNTSSNYTTAVYYQVHGEVYQSISGLLGIIDRSEWIDQIVTDDSINFAFPEIQEELEALREEREALEQEEREAQELAELQQKIAEAGLSEEVAGLVLKIRSKIDDWNFNLWNGNQNMGGNASYFKVRCILRNGKSLNDIRRIQPTIEAELRHSVVINERQDKRAFDLTVILESQLKPYAMKSAELIDLNKQGKIFIGKSYTGELITQWNYQANHAVFAGKSGSGKSEAIREFLMQMAWLDDGGKDFDFTTMFLTSSSKIGDFADFGKRGALVASGIDAQIQVFAYVLKMLEAREALFYKESVQNIKDYNKKHPDSRMPQLILLADEYENTRGDLDKKKAQEAESLMVSILNIARSSGCVVLIGAQSILKQDIGTIKDKMTIRFSGKNEKNVLNTVDPSIASYYASYRGKPQGVFFYQADNLEIAGDYITQGETSFTLIQTPYLSDISTKTLPQLHGSEHEAEIFGSSHEDVDSGKEEETLADFL